MSDIVELLQVPYEDYLRGYVIEDIKAEAAAEILRLRAELASANEQLVRADLKLNAIRAENEKLREALKPFSDKSHFHREGAFWMDTVFTVKECRAAAAAYKETGNE